MKRRNILKRLGVAAGIGAGTVPSVTVEAAPPGEELPETEGSITELEIEAMDLDGDLPFAASCLNFPRVIPSHSAGEAALYIGRYSNQDIQLSEINGLIAHHRGVTPISENSIDLGAAPVQASIMGGFTSVDGLTLPDLEIGEVGQNGFQGTLGDTQFQINPGRRSTAEVETQVESLRDDIDIDEVRLRISGRVTNRARIVGHPDHLVVPASQRWRAFADHYRSNRNAVSGSRTQGESVQSETQGSDQSPTEIRIREHNNGLEISQRGG